MRRSRRSRPAAIAERPGRPSVLRRDAGARSRPSASMRCTASTTTAVSPPRARSATRRWCRWCRSASSGLASCRRFRTSPARAQELLQLLFRNFVPGISEQAAWWFQYFAGSAAQATAIGIVGTAAIGVLLLVTVEDQLNALWRVTAPRPWVQRILAYWTLITHGAAAGRDEPDPVDLSQHTPPAAPASTRTRSPNSPAAGRIFWRGWCRSCSN